MKPIDKILESLNELCAGEIKNGITVTSMAISRQCGKELLNYIYDLNKEIDELRNNRHDKKICPYCIIRQYKEHECINGKEFDLQKTTDYKDNYMKYASWIMKDEGDEKAGVMITTYGQPEVYFDINYCPMCGRKIGDNDE